MKLISIEGYKESINKSIFNIDGLRALKNGVISLGDTFVLELDISNEPLGYWVYQGFEVVSMSKKAGNLYIVKIKKVKCSSSNIDKKYSWLIKLPRTGKNAKRIYVYKLRTMQPYSEYIQDLVIKYNGLNEDGTIKNDFRITKLGGFLRRYWLDELPMLINFIKGDLKLIGIRPLSDTMLSKYPQDFVTIRNYYKPGLIPPYYIDSPKSFEGLIESERRYLQRYNDNGFITDIKYFLMFLKKVIFSGVRSK